MRGRCWNKSCDRDARFRDGDFLSQRDTLEKPGKVCLRLMNVHFHQNKYGLSQWTKSSKIRGGKAEVSCGTAALGCAPALFQSDLKPRVIPERAHLYGSVLIIASGEARDRLLPRFVPGKVCRGDRVPTGTAERQLRPSARIIRRP